MRQEVIQKAPEQAKKPSPNMTGIPTQMKLDFERRSGLSFDDVRVHYNSDKPRKIGALAYTQGNQVHIGPGQDRHLRHELGHIVQQKTSVIKATETIQGIPVNTSQELEARATRLDFTYVPTATDLTTTNHVVQMYSIGQVEGVGLCCISRGGRLVCSLSYPNHFFYTRDDSDICWGRIGSGDSKIGIDKVPSSEIEEYTKWTAKYRQHNESLIKADAIETMERYFAKQLPNKHIIAYDKITQYAQELKHNLEMFRKALVHDAILTNAKPDDSFGGKAKLYRDLSELFNTPSSIKKPQEFLDKINSEMDSVTVIVGAGPGLLQDVNNALQRSWMQFYTEMKIVMKSGASSTKRFIKAINYAYLDEQRSSLEPLFPRGCDFIKACISQTAPGPQRFFLSSKDMYYSSSEAPHHATIVAMDGNDFICIEGYANRNFKFFDNSWEFVMYGTNNTLGDKDQLESFALATTYRHTLMRGKPDESKMAYEPASKTDLDRNIPKIFENLNNHLTIY